MALCHIQPLGKNNHTCPFSVFVFNEYTSSSTQKAQMAFFINIQIHQDKLFTSPCKLLIIFSLALSLFLSMGYKNRETSIICGEANFFLVMLSLPSFFLFVFVFLLLKHIYTCMYIIYIYIYIDKL